jgi:hypothetical protein
VGVGDEKVVERMSAEDKTVVSNVSIKIEKSTTHILAID